MTSLSQGCMFHASDESCAFFIAEPELEAEPTSQARFRTARAPSGRYLRASFSMAIALYSFEVSGLRRALVKVTSTPASIVVFSWKRSAEFWSEDFSEHYTDEKCTIHPEVSDRPTMTVSAITLLSVPVVHSTSPPTSTWLGWLYSFNGSWYPCVRDRFPRSSVERQRRMASRVGGSLC